MPTLDSIAGLISHLRCQNDELRQSRDIAQARASVLEDQKRQLDRLLVAKDEETVEEVRSLQDGHLALQSRIAELRSRLAQATAAARKDNDDG